LGPARRWRRAAVQEFVNTAFESSIEDGFGQGEANNGLLQNGHSGP
jgi:hypothetical protein